MDQARNRTPEDIMRTHRQAASSRRLVRSIRVTALTALTCLVVIVWSTAGYSADPRAPHAGDPVDSETVVVWDSGQARDSSNTDARATTDSTATQGYSPEACTPWYHPSSPWRQPIGPNPEVISDPAYYVEGNPAKGMKAFWDETNETWLELSSDTSQYTYPVHYVDNSLPLVKVTFSGVLSHVKDDGRNLVGGRYIAADDGDGDEDRTDRRRWGTGTYSIRIDPHQRYAIPAGSDRQFIFINTDTGEEFGGWHAEDADGDGCWEPWDGERLENGYVYNLLWTGYPPGHDSNNNYQFMSRGAGVPYGAGLIRRCEIERGRIDHVIAFAHPRNHDRAFVFPATKTDGYKMPDEPTDRLGDVLPEGQLVQLDPAISEETLQSWGCTGACLTIAKALQQYGMRTVDNSRSLKVFAEHESTAQWSSLPDDLQVVRQTVARIPVQHFRPIANPHPLNAQIRGLSDYGTESR